MVREQILVQDFEKISRKYDYYLWNFVWKGEGMYHSMRTIFDESSEDIESSNHLKYFLEVFDIPYFESYIQDSMDFLDVLGVPLNNLRIKNTNMINPFMITFNRRRLVNATYNGFCVCPEGITKLLYDLNPEIVLNAKLD